MILFLPLIFCFSTALVSGCNPPMWYESDSNNYVTAHLTYTNTGSSPTSTWTIVITFDEDIDFQEVSSSMAKIKLRYSYV